MQGLQIPAGLYCPAGHGLHSLLSQFGSVPGGQSSQRTPIELYIVAPIVAQGMQPVRSEFISLPGGQATRAIAHAGQSTAAYSGPAVSGSFSSAHPTQNVAAVILLGTAPGSHGRQPFPSGLYRKRWQPMHAVRSLLAW